MQRIILVSAVGLACSGAVLAESSWKGSGELGLAYARGNAKAETINAKLGFQREEERWSWRLSAALLRQKGEVAGAFDVTANRYELAAAGDYKFNERSYLGASVRFEKDDFAAFERQLTLALALGYTLIDDEATKLSVEAGPGYRRIDPVPFGVVLPGPPPRPVIVDPDWSGELIGRGQARLEHAFNEQTALSNVLLLETGSDNTFVQNDLGVAVKMSEAFALKTGFQVRYNSEVPRGLSKTDRLFTTNLVYSF